jgi:alkyl hydroperoxide reductase subunit AhpC
MGACTSNDAGAKADTKQNAPIPRPPGSPDVVPHECVKVNPKVIQEAKAAAEQEIKRENASRRASAVDAQCKYLRIGDDAPDFDCDSTLGRINWHQYIEGSWAILFSHPKDFTPVCTTEIGLAANLEAEFLKRKCKLAVVSVDDVECHKKWLDEINRLNQSEVKFPLLGDETKKISMLYGMLDQTNIDAQGLPMTVRSVFIIGPDKKIKLILTYPASCGRNFFEILRCLDSLQLTMKAKCATPANWSPGEKVCLLPSMSDEEAAKYPSLHVQSASCKLRMVDAPKVD